MAGRYDQPLTAWRALRDEVLLQRDRLLAKEVAALDSEADDYVQLIVAP